MSEPILTERQLVLLTELGTVSTMLSDKRRARAADNLVKLGYAKKLKNGAYQRTGAGKKRAIGGAA